MIYEKQSLEPMWVERGIVVDEQGAVLLAQRAARCRDGGQWECPGGKVAGDTWQERITGLQREVYEETRVETVVDPSEPLYISRYKFPDTGRTRITEFRPAFATASCISIDLSEVADAHWVPLRELSAYRDRMTPASRAALRLYGHLLLQLYRH